MKKIIIAASMLFAAMAANAQEPMTTTTTTTSVVPGARMYKPVAGDVLAELGFLVGGIGANPTSLSPSPFSSPTNVIPQLKFRYFLQDQLALRVGFNFTQQGNTTKYYEVTPGSGVGSVKTANSVFALNLGAEKHFTGTGRLSTYVGGDISFQKIGVSEKWENSDGTGFVNGASRTYKGTNAAGDNGSTGFGLRAVAGADYYFVDKVYLGAEFGWGFIASKNGKAKIEDTAGGVTTTTETKTSGGAFNLAPSLTAGLRLGFRF